MHELRHIMKDNNLTTDDVAKLLDRKKNTIEGWLSKNPARPIPSHMMKLLKLQLKAK